jgi:hypothetical protein
MHSPLSYRYLYYLAALHVYSFNQWIVLVEPKTSGHNRLIDIDVTGVYILYQRIIWQLLPKMRVILFNN